MTQRFYHVEGVNSATVEFEGRTVLYVTRPGEVFLDPGSYIYYAGRYDQRVKLIRVVGSVVGDYKKIQTPGNPVLVTDVEPITDKVEREELTDLLLKNESNLKRRKVMFNIYFWDNTFSFLHK